MLPGLLKGDLEHNTLEAIVASCTKHGVLLLQREGVRGEVEVRGGWVRMG